MEVIGTLGDIRAPEIRSATSVFDRAAARWSPRLLASSGVLFGLLALLAGIHWVAPLPRALVVGAFGLGLSVQLLSLGALVLLIGSGLASTVRDYRQFGRICQEEAAHDYEAATQLASYSLEALEAADRWVEQKLRRLERRQIRFFGGPDKLALAVVLIAGWAAWKEVKAALLLWQPSVLLFGTAFLVGLAIGGVAISHIADRLAYQRDLLHIAKTLTIKSSTRSHL